jgi:hypothetical protein
MYLRSILTIFTLVLLLLINSRTFSQSEVLYDGEELYYEVDYSFINIGWAKFNTEKMPGKENFYTTRAKLKSNNLARPTQASKSPVKSQMQPSILLRWRLAHPQISIGCRRHSSRCY